MMYAATTTLARTAVRSASAARMPQAASTLRRGYHEKVVEHYENPRNVGSLDKNDDNVGTVRALLSCSLLTVLIGHVLR